MNKVEFGRKIYKTIQSLRKQDTEYSCIALRFGFRYNCHNMRHIISDYQDLFTQGKTRAYSWLDELEGRTEKTLPNSEKYRQLRISMILLFKDYALDNELYLDY